MGLPSTFGNIKISVEQKELSSDGRNSSWVTTQGPEEVELIRGGIPFGPVRVLSGGKKQYRIRLEDKASSGQVTVQYRPGASNFRSLEDGITLTPFSHQHTLISLKDNPDKRWVIKRC